MAKKILTVEDDPALAGALSEKLKEAGFEVFLASDGEAGLKAAEREKPALLVLDLILPRKSGFEVLEELRDKEAFRFLPVLILTNLESPYDIERASAFGIKAYLVKANYSLSEIVKKIEEILA